MRNVWSVRRAHSTSRTGCVGPVGAVDGQGLARLSPAGHEPRVGPGRERGLVELGDGRVHHEEEVHLVGGGPDQQVDARRRAGADRHGSGRSGRTRPSTTGCSGRPWSNGVDSASRRCAASRSATGSVTQPTRLAWRDAHLGQELLGDGGCGLRLVHVRARAALQDGPLEQPAGRRHRKQRGHAHRAGRLAEDRDPFGIAAERGDVVPHPLERGHLVEDAGVARALEPLGDALEVQEPEHAEAVVDRDDHDARARPAGCRRTRGSDPEPVRNPPPWIHTITARPASSQPGGEHVEAQAVLAARRPRRRRASARGPTGSAARSGPDARHGRTPVPGLRRTGRGEAGGAAGGRGVGDAAEGGDAPDVLPLDAPLAGGGLDRGHGRMLRNDVAPSGAGAPASGAAPGRGSPTT